MRHAAHKANKDSVQRTSPSALFRSSRGSHTARAVRAVQAANGDAVALAIDPVFAAKLNEVAPMTRRAIRETAKAAQRKSYMMSSASLAALVGTAATALAFSNIQQSSNSRLLADDPATTTTQLARVTGSTVSRSESRTELGPIASDQTAAAATSGAADAKTSNTIADAKFVQTTNNGNWELNDKNSAIDVSQLSRSLANNPQVAVLVDHATGDSGLAYAFSQCTWWAYLRRHQLGLPVGSYFGNGQDWANSARAHGYWVDNTPRHKGDVMVFRAGQEGASSVYGHVAIVESINADGTVTVSECGASLNGKPASRTLSNVNDFQYIHY